MKRERAMGRVMDTTIVDDAQKKIGKDRRNAMRRTVWTV